MRINSLSLPHPVLGVGDDVKGSYEVTCEVTLSPKKVTLSLIQKLLNKTLQDMIKNGTAVFSAEVNCPQTIFRKSYSSTEEKNQIEIPANMLRNRVFVNFYVSAAKNLNDYQVEGANSDYADYSFEISGGDVLAWGGSSSFLALKDWRALKAADSFLEIDKYTDAEGPIKIKLNQDKVLVLLAERDYEQYLLYRKNRSLFPVFHSSIVFPVLIFVLGKMKEEPEEYSDCRWYQVLKFRRDEEKELQRFDWNLPEHLPLIAQQLLANPVSRMLDAAEDLLKLTQEVETE